MVAFVTQASVDGLREVALKAEGEKLRRVECLRILVEERRKGGLWISEKDVRELEKNEIIGLVAELDYVPQEGVKFGVVLARSRQTGDIGWHLLGYLRLQSLNNQSVVT